MQRMISMLHSRHLSIQKRKQFQNLRLGKSVHSPSIALNVPTAGEEFNIISLDNKILGN